MQRLAREVAAHRGERRIGDAAVARLAVQRIADDGQAESGEMDADLVGAPGDQAAAQQRQPAGAPAVVPAAGTALGQQLVEGGGDPLDRRRVTAR